MNLTHMSKEATTQLIASIRSWMPHRAKRVHTPTPPPSLHYLVQVLAACGVQGVLKHLDLLDHLQPSADRGQ